MGSAAAYCCARLRVARANRAVTLFALFRFVFLLLFSAVVVVFVSVAPQAALFPLTPPHILYPASTVIHSLHFALLHFIHSFLPLLFPQKKLHCTAKNRATPAAKPWASGTLRVISVRHPRSTRSRLAPLHYAGKKLLRYCSAYFYRSVPAQGCFTCVVLVLRPRTAPDHPPLNSVDFFILFALPRRLLKYSQRATKKCSQR